MISAAIFDMDGVMVDNFYIHLEAWNIFCKKHQIDISEQSLKQHAFGRTNDELMPYFFQREMSKSEISLLEKEKESIYRDVYRGRVSLVEGLTDFLIELNNSNIKTAVGTSAPRANADFILTETNLTKYFQLIVDGSMVTKGKPDPEIYLLAAKTLNVKPSDCVVFEDSFAGIEAAHKAGMKVVGVATTHSADKLLNCNKVIRNFTEIKVSDIKDLS
jgi:beta-phosphoglucomutase